MKRKKISNILVICLMSAGALGAANCPSSSEPPPWPLQAAFSAIKDFEQQYATAVRQFPIRSWKIFGQLAHENKVRKLTRRMAEAAQTFENLATSVIDPMFKRENVQEKLGQLISSYQYVGEYGVFRVRTKNIEEPSIFFVNRDSQSLSRQWNSPLEFAINSRLYHRDQPYFIFYVPIYGFFVAQVQHRISDANGYNLYHLSFEQAAELIEMLAPKP